MDGPVGGTFELTTPVITVKRQEANDFRVQHFGSAEMIAFICECADESCRRSVLLSPGTFKWRREHGELILYPGHEALADNPMAAERDAARKSEEATDSTIA